MSEKKGPNDDLDELLRKARNPNHAPTEEPYIHASVVKDDRHDPFRIALRQMGDYLADLSRAAIGWPKKKPKDLKL